MEELDPQKIKEQIEELRNLIATGKQELLNSEALVTTVKQLVATIQEYSTKFDDLRKKIDDPTTGILTDIDSVKRVKGEIDTIRQDSDIQLATIKTTLATVEANITTMNAEYSKFTDITTTIFNPESGLSAIFKKSGALKLEIDKFREDSEVQLTTIKTALTTVQKNITEMTQAYADFLVLKTKIDDPQDGLANLHDLSTQIKDEIVALKAQSETLFQEIKKFRDESKNYTNEIEELKRIAKESAETVEGYEAEGKDLKDKIEKIYKIAIDAGLANSFDERRKGLEKTTVQWFWSLMVSTGLLAVSLILIFLPFLSKETTTIDAYMWYRVTLTSPLIFFIAFASLQYSKERSLLEKYAFKAVTAVALEGYTTLLINTFGQTKENNEREILNFVLNSMSSIYKEPHEILKESKFSFGVDSKLASLKADFTNTMEEAKKDMAKIVQEEVGKAGNKPRTV